MTPYRHDFVVRASICSQHFWLRNQILQYEYMYHTKRVPQIKGYTTNQEVQSPLPPSRCPHGKRPARALKSRRQVNPRRVHV